MLYGMYVSAAGALANSYRQDVIANNLANAETVGFKRDLALFQSRETASAQRGQRKFTAPMLEGIGGGVFALPTYTDFSPASLDETGGALDFAIAGDGFFQVQNGDEVNYTRDGRFALNDEGQLVTRVGRMAVLDDRGVAIFLEAGVKINVDEAGVISQADSQVAKLGIVDFEDRRVLSKKGGNLYVSSGGRGREVEATVKQEYLENSGVNTMTALVAMMETARRFQNNITMLQMQDQSLGLAVSKLGNIS